MRELRATRQARYLVDSADRRFSLDQESVPGTIHRFGAHRAIALDIEALTIGTVRKRLRVGATMSREVSRAVEWLGL